MKWQIFIIVHSISIMSYNIFIRYSFIKLYIHSQIHLSFIYFSFSPPKKVNWQSIDLEKFKPVMLAALRSLYLWQMFRRSVGFGQRIHQTKTGGLGGATRSDNPEGHPKSSSHTFWGERCLDGIFGGSNYLLIRWPWMSREYMARCFFCWFSLFLKIMEGTIWKEYVYLYIVYIYI